MKLLTVGEAAAFLRISKSTLYQRKTIPRYRLPGSRVLLFDQEELETWIKASREDRANAEASPIDLPTGAVYHRNPRYR